MKLYNRTRTIWHHNANCDGVKDIKQHGNSGRSSLDAKYSSATRPSGVFSGYNSSHVPDKLNVCMFVKHDDATRKSILTRSWKNSSSPRPHDAIP